MNQVLSIVAQVHMAYVLKKMQLILGISIMAFLAPGSPAYLFIVSPASK